MSKRFLLGILVTSMAFFAEVTAGYQLQVGDSYAIKNVLKGDFALTVEKEKFKSYEKHEADFTLNVTEVNQEGTYTATVTLNDFSVETTALKSPNPLFKQAIHDAVVGQTFKITFTSEGDVLKVTDYDIPARVCAIVPEGNDKKALCVLLNDIWGEKAMQENINGLLVLYSSEGKTWKKTIPVPIMPDLKVVQTVTLGNSENPHEIPFTSGLTLVNKSRCFMGLKNFVFEGQGNGVGKLSIDPVTGWCLSRTHTTTISGIVSGRESGVNVKAPFKFRTTQITKSKKL